jgi:hypothetical protein
MYSEQDLRDAVAAGAISEEAAAALRNHVAAVRQAPPADEESFRLVTSFNDIFVTIAAIILLVAMGGIGNAIAPVVGSVLAAAASWAMAEFFTSSGAWRCLRSCCCFPSSAASSAPDSS